MWVNWCFVFWRRCSVVWRCVWWECRVLLRFIFVLVWGMFWVVCCGVWSVERVGGVEVIYDSCSRLFWVVVWMVWLVCIWVWYWCWWSSFCWLGGRLCMSCCLIIVISEWCWGFVRCCFVVFWCFCWVIVILVVVFWGVF